MENALIIALVGSVVVLNFGLWLAYNRLMTLRDMVNALDRDLSQVEEFLKNTKFLVSEEER